MGNERILNPTTDILPAPHHIFEAKLLKKYSNKNSVLDIGCWTGQFLSLLDNAKEVTGIDISKRAINFARKNRKGNFLVASALKLPFKNNQFDLVTMLDVVEHLPKGYEERAIIEAARVLKKGGFFAISTVTKHLLSILLDPAFFFFGHRHYSKEELEKILKNSGLNPRKTKYTGGFWSLFGHNFALLQKHLFKSKKIYIPFRKLSKKEFKNGFDQIHIIAQKY